MAPPPKVAPKTPTTISEADSQAIRPPSLTVCINERAVGPDRVQDSTQALPAGTSVSTAHLKTVIDGICTQLTDASFDTVWDTPAGKLPIEPSTDDELLEEAWAKGIDELTLGTAYTGPDIIPAFPSKGSVKSAIRYVYGRFSLDPNGTGDFSVPKDPAISLGMACQHMTTYGLLARGVSVAETSGVGVAASQSTAGLPIFKNRPNSWHSEESPTPDAKQASSIPFVPINGAEAHTTSIVTAKATDFGPGAVYTYNPLHYKRSMLTIVDLGDCLMGKDNKPQTDGEGNYVLAPGKAITATLETQKQQAELAKNAPSVANTTEGALASQNDAAKEAKEKAGSSTLGGGKVVAKMSLAAQLDGSHASMILRVYKTKGYTQPGDDGKAVGEHQRVQLLDSGARMSCPEVSKQDMERSYIMVSQLGGKGHLCGEGYTMFPGAQENFVGFGTVPKIEHGDEMKGLLAKTRHVGVARLAISAESPKPGEADFYYLSRCIPLWKGDKRFSLARLAWSLRNSALAKSLRAYWIVYSPRGWLAQVMWEEGARDKTLAVMMKEALELHNAQQVDEKKKRTALSVRNDLLPIAIFSTHEAGHALQIWRGHCLSASGSGQPPDAVKRLFIAGTPDMTLFKEMEKKFKGDWEAERQRLKAKQDAVNQVCKDDLAAYKKSKDPVDLQVYQLKQKHQLAGDFDWFDATHDRDTYDADIAADKANEGKPPKPRVDPVELTAYRQWAETPFAEKYAHPLETARDKIDGEYCSLPGALVPHELLQ